MSSLLHGRVETLRAEIASLKADLRLQERKHRRRVQAREREAWIRGLVVGLALAQGDRAAARATCEAKLTDADLKRAGASDAERRIIIVSERRSKS